MSRNKWLMAAAILAANAAVVAPHAVRVYAQVNEYKADTRDSDTDFKRKTDAKTLDLEVGGAANHARLRVSMKISRGRMWFRLLDPAGAERLQGEVSEGRGSFDTKEMAATPGIWKLHIERQGASGDYDLHWRVR